MDDKTLTTILDVIMNTASPTEMNRIMETMNNHILNHIYTSYVHEELLHSFDSSTCPHCHSSATIRYGKDKKRNQRYYCNHCHKTFSAITGTLLSYTKKEPSQWYLYLESLLRGDTLVQSANIANICEYTSLVWRHKILSICATITDTSASLCDTIYLDEKLVSVKHPGVQQKEPITKAKRGISDQKRNIACAVDEHNNTIIEVSECGRIHASTLLRVFKDYIPSTCSVVSDSLRSYHRFMKDLKVTWIKIPSGKKEQEGYTLDKVNLLHSSIELFLHKYRGIADKYLRNYIGLFKMKDRHKDFYKKVIQRELYTCIVNSLCALKFEDFSENLNFSMI